MNEIVRVNQTKIFEELINHCHKSSRKIKGKFRNTEHARQELVAHYRYAHLLAD
jgi:hypothetical protein